MSRHIFGIRVSLAVLTLHIFSLHAVLAQTRVDLYIHVAGDDSLDATYYVPQSTIPPAGYPALLFVHGFGLTKDEDTSNCKRFATLGVLSLTYSVRGQGQSSGTTEIMDGAERKDLKSVFAFLTALPMVDTTKIGISGGSQGGLHGLWAIADRLPVAAVSADVIVPTWASDMFANGSIRRMFVELLRSKPVRYGAMRDTLWDLLRRDEFDSLKARFTGPRDMDTAELHNSQTPLMTFLKWQDHYFSPQPGIASYAEYQGTKKLYLGTVGHFSDLSPGESQFQYDQVNRWFKYFLLGQSTGILGEPPVTYATSSLPVDSSGYFTWTHEQIAEWPPSGTQELRLYFIPDSSLDYTLPGPFDVSYLLRNAYNDPTYTFDTAYAEGFKGPAFDAALPTESIGFTSSPLPAPLHWVGAPRLVMNVSSMSQKFPLNAQIYEVDSLGVKHFINRIFYTGRNWTTGHSAQIAVNGLPHSHMFSQESRIRIELTNIDAANLPSFGPYPFVLPLLADVSVDINISSSQPSYVAFPVLASPGYVTQRRGPRPETFELSQNYPNPFNPKTAVRCQWSVDSDVRLVVYDVLGRDVAVLMNGRRPAGRYHVEFDATGLASGVYFCQLTATSALSGTRYSSIRKMVLLK